MLVSVKINNCLIYNSETEFSMQANRHYKRFPNNVASFEELGVLKTAVIFGPNNAGKTNFVNILSMIKRIFLNQDAHISKNLFNPNPLCELTVSFIEKDAEYLFSAKYDAEKREYLYERFAQVHRDRYGNRKETTMLLRDSLAESYICENAELEAVMKVAAKNNLFMYLIDTSKFSKLHEIKEILTGFAGRIDIVDMNNIPIKKTIDMLKLSNQKQEKIKHFILNADISLEDFHYAGEDELKLQLSDEKHDMERKPQENALSAAAPLMEAAVVGLNMPDSYYIDLQNHYQHMKDLFTGGLKDLGFTFTDPQGAYYVMMDISKWKKKDETDVQFCERLAAEVGVGAVPGSSFFREEVNHLIRLHFAREEKTIDEALSRLAKLKDLL